MQEGGDDDRSWESLNVNDKVKAKGLVVPDTYRRGKVVEVGQSGHRITICFDDGTRENISRSQVIKLVPRVGNEGLDEVGQTNSTIVGSNFMKALEKGYQHAFGLKGFTDLKPGLQRQGIDPSSLDGPVGRAGGHRPRWPPHRLATQQNKELIWTQCAQMYTGGSLYKALNCACRKDAVALLDFADFIGVLIFGGHIRDQQVCSFAPQCTRPTTTLTVYRGFSLDPDLVSSYPAGQTFYWQSFVSTSLSVQTATSFAHNNTTATTAPFVFRISVPEYNPYGMRAYDLSQISLFKSEDEILLLPYTSVSRGNLPPTFMVPPLWICTCCAFP
jgi:hypothetical protein